MNKESDDNDIKSESRGFESQCAQHFLSMPSLFLEAVDGSWGKYKNCINHQEEDVQPQIHIVL